MTDFPGREPTGAECGDNAIVSGCMAGWYPQMGGYVGKCWIVSGDNADDDACFSVAVYHDGEFPFGESVAPTILHHCSAEQFIRFGRICNAFLSGRWRE